MCLCEWMCVVGIYFVNFVESLQICARNRLSNVLSLPYPFCFVHNGKSCTLLLCVAMAIIVWYYFHSFICCCGVACCPRVSISNWWIGGLFTLNEVTFN